MSNSLNIQSPRASRAHIPLVARIRLRIAMAFYRRRARRLQMAEAQARAAEKRRLATIELYKARAQFQADYNAARLNHINRMNGGARA